MKLTTIKLHFKIELFYLFVQYFFKNINLNTTIYINLIFNFILREDGREENVELLD